MFVGHPKNIEKIVMNKLRIDKLAVLLSALLISFSIFAQGDSKYKLAKECTLLMHPAELYSVYEPIAKGCIEPVDFDGLKLPKYEKKILREKLEQKLHLNLVELFIKSRAEVYTERELDILIKHYQSKLGKQIIKKLHQAQGRPVIYTQQELDFNIAFANEYKEIAKKTGDLMICFGIKLKEQSSKFGSDVALLIAGHCHDYNESQKT